MELNQGPPQLFLLGATKSPLSLPSGQMLELSTEEPRSGPLGGAGYGGGHEGTEVAPG